jgi:hypothetical protein
LRPATARVSLEREKACVDLTPQRVIGLGEFAPDRHEVRRERGDAFDGVLVEHAHLVAQVPQLAADCLELDREPLERPDIGAERLNFPGQPLEFADLTAELADLSAELAHLAAEPVDLTPDLGLTQLERA